MYRCWFSLIPALVLAAAALWSLATREELQVIYAAMASIDAGEMASEREVEAAFARFRCD